MLHRTQLIIALIGTFGACGVTHAAFTPLSTGFETSDGYGAPGSTAIGIEDQNLLVNQDGDTGNDVAWVRTGPGSDPQTLAVTSNAANGSAQGLFITDSFDNEPRSASLDLTGQEIPTDAVWSFELALMFDSTSRATQDEVYVALGSSVDNPLIHFGLRRPGGNTAYRFDYVFETAGGLEVVLADAFETATYVHTRVEVTPAGVNGQPNGRLRLWVDGVEQTLANSSLPSLTATPDALHVYTTDTATGIARFDELSIVPEPASATLLATAGAVLLRRRR